MTGVNSLTGFDRIENDMAMRYATRKSGWPVGREYRGIAWSCVTPTVQIVQQRGKTGLKKYIVVTLFPFLRTDRRHPPSALMSLINARGFASRRLRELGNGELLSEGRGHGIELAKCGDYIGLEVFL